jgi:hypothetical protein
MDATAQATQLAEQLGAVLTQLPEATRPRLIAALERLAAERYDAWAAAAHSADETSGLAACAARERDIANKIEAAYPQIAQGSAILIEQAANTYSATFEGKDRAYGFALQAALERAGADAWRSLAALDPARQSLLLECAALEEASATFLEQLAGS